MVDEALREWGVESEVTKQGANADAASPLVPPSRAQRARTDALIDATYATFKQRVEAGRGLTPAAVAAAAKGRVWTGEQVCGGGTCRARGTRCGGRRGDLPLFAPLPMPLRRLTEEALEQLHLAEPTDPPTHPLTHPPTHLSPTHLSPPSAARPRRWAWSTSWAGWRRRWRWPRPRRGCQPSRARCW